MGTLSMKRLNIIRRLVDSATPPPWDSYWHDHLADGCRCGSCVDDKTVGYKLTVQYECPAEGCEEEVFSWQNKDFIVGARKDMPDLLAVVEGVQRQIDATNDCPLCYAYVYEKYRHKDDCPMKAFEE